MNSLRTLIRRPWLRLLLCLALAMRVVTPAGVMAGAAGDGGLTFKLCTATGLQTIALPADPASPAPPAAHEAGTCLAALAAGAALAPTVATRPAPGAFIVDRAEPSASVAILPSVLRTQTSRGPPLPLPRR